MSVAWCRYICNLLIYDRAIICCSEDGDHIRYEYCNTFDFMIGMLFYNIPDSDSDGPLSSFPKSAFALFELMVTTNNVALNRMAYNISYAASMYDSDNAPAYNTPEWLENAFCFCTLPDFGACSILIFNTYDAKSHAVTEYNYELARGACRDTFTTDYW
jgi:hypothetical protein